METWGQTPQAAVEAPVHIDADRPMIMDGVPIDLVNFFGLDIAKMDNKIKTQLNDIYTLSSKNGEKMGDVLQKIRQIDSRMGQPGFGELRHSRIWNYLRIHGQITELEKQRDSMLRY